MGAIISYMYPEDVMGIWDEKTMRNKYLVHKQIKDSKKIKLKPVNAKFFIKNLKRKKILNT